MDGLTQPLKGWVKGFNPATLSKAINEAWSMASSSTSSSSSQSYILNRQRFRGTNLCPRSHRWMKLLDRNSKGRNCVSIARDLGSLATNASGKLRSTTLRSYSMMRTNKNKCQSKISNPTITPIWSI